MSAEVMQPYQAGLDPASTGSLFSCSRSDIPCHHFCLRHSRPLQLEVEEWFMTDESEEEVEDEDKKQGEEPRVEEEEDEETELAHDGLLDQLLDEAYAHYYEEPDEWDELAHWYTSRMNSDEPCDAEHQSSQSSGAASSGAAPQQQDFHPAWRRDEPTVGRFARGSENSASDVTPRSAAASSPFRGQHQPAEPSAAPSTSRGGQRRSSAPEPAGGAGLNQPRGSKRRDWAELADEQEREEEMELSSTNHQHRRGSSNGWSETAVVRECELYETFNDLFFPDPESGRS